MAGALSFAAEVVEDSSGLLARCRAGDPRAQRELYEQNIRFVLGSARRLGLPPAELEDVAQEVFAITFKSIDRVQPNALRGWLYQLVSHRVHSHHRRRRVHDFFTGLFGHDAPSDSGALPPGLARSDAQRQLDLLLPRLSRERREVLVLFELEGLSGEAIAAQLGLPVATVWTRLHRARNDLVRAARRGGVLDELRQLGQLPEASR